MSWKRSSSKEQVDCLVTEATSTNNSRLKHKKTRRLQGCFLGLVASVWMLWEKRLVVSLPGVVLSSENAASIATTTAATNMAGSTMAAPKTTCFWAVLAGDSNTRFLWDDILQLVQNHYGDDKQQQQSKNATTKYEIQLHHPNHTFPDGTIAWKPLNAKCGFWWADNEVIVTITTTGTSSTKNFDNGSRCIILTKKFLTNQNASTRLVGNGNLLNMSYCGTEMEPLLPATSVTDNHQHPQIPSHYNHHHHHPPAILDNFQRPPRPHFLWFAHGLWGIPNAGAHARGLDCPHRFQTILRDLNAIHQIYNHHPENNSDNVLGGSTGSSSSSSNQLVGEKPTTTETIFTPATKLLWVTNFEINGHVTIKNDYLKWEIACQKDQFRQYKQQIHNTATSTDDDAKDTGWELLDLNARIDRARMVQNGDSHLTVAARSQHAQWVVSTYMPGLLAPL